MKQNSRQSVKNYQSEETIRQLYEITFHKPATNLKISLMSGGLKNAVYLVEDEDQKVVLKVAPKDESKMISADRNVLWWEAEMLQLMEQIDFPSPRLLSYDDSCKVCEAPYIFMSHIDGDNYLDKRKNMTEEEIKNVEYQLGFLSKEICSISSKKFFLPSQPEKEFKDNFEFTMCLFDMLLADAEEKNMDLGENAYDVIRRLIITHKDSLNNISNLCLAHTDIWDGNVLVKDGNVTGIVDFTDLYFCDELMTFYFHTIDGITSPDFLEGYNKTLTPDEKVRIEIYRMYVILKMIVDCELKQYGRFDWMYTNLNSKIDGLQKIKK